MINSGIACLSLALGLGVFAFGAALGGIKRKNEIWLENSRKASYGSVLFTAGAGLVLLRAFLADDFRFAYVARNSERSLPLIYKVSAFWAGQSGSLLLWLLLLSVLALVILGRKKYKRDNLDLKVTAVIHALRILFLFLLVFVTSPFEKAEVLFGDGQGLNPMLQSLGMVVHPPILFLGFSGFAVPFGLAVVALGERGKGAAWIKASRPWLLFSWLMLTMGIVTGGQWAYNELGWGGYWAWDPVENASLFPWLTATALIHALWLPVQRRYTKFWCFLLTALTFLLTIFGTFLTRSGVLDSVHAFAGGILGNIFLVVLIALAAFSFYLGLSRRNLLIGEKASQEDTSWFSKEGGILAGLVLLLLIFGAVFLGTMFPLLSRALGGREIVLDAEFYNQISVPLFLALFLILGFAPFLNKGRTNWRRLGRKIGLPGLLGLGAALLFYFRSSGHLAGSLSFGIGTFGILTHLCGLLSKFNRHKLGVALAHIGVLIMLLGISGSSIFVQDTFQSVEPGQSLQVGGYRLDYSGLRTVWGVNQHAVETTLEVYQGDKYFGEITSRKIFRQNREQPATDVGILSTFKEDLYLNLAGWQGQTAQLHVQTFALVLWIWIGSAIIYLGVIIILVPFGRLLKKLGR
ncbi:MAG: heme lyase CcmF/NrfE family subunit [Firmicutes bacterium]|nr:heme lyase CcmF/NrfE family subunit [Bacillota bacterium]